MDWDEYLMRLVYTVALKSKDESTKFGAVVVTQDNSIVSTGYNSFPRGLNDNIPERQQRPLKYMYFAHAEQNAVFNAAKIGKSLKNCVMFTQGVPCADCARAVVQSGITKVIVHYQWEKVAKDIFGDWDNSRKITEQMFSECNVTITAHGFPALGLKTFIRGKWYDI